MSNLIAFLEAMGQDAGIRHASGGSLYHVLDACSVSAEERWAILRGDFDGIDAPRITCCVFAPEKHDDNDDDGDEQQDDDEIRLLAAA